ncbi:LPS assembly lipoprotein LptE [Hasllibacter sp. MH4015]|uniref:LPS assembly lipoprotein LptE n=1 Tax=Hasllibacter sp. MH4015 TaxID=2854029 RepID=UPI001CD44C27|nr:LPS assembly lipoprotein LptE [Hasllibacter sp. MH4015]
MSSFNRRHLLLGLGALPLGACNFQPVYGNGGSGDVIRNRITVAAPDTRLEFEMVARLEDRLGVGGAYSLSYDVTTSTRNVAIDGAENIDRINVIGSLAFTVREAGTGRVVQTGEVSTFTAYATTASPVATASARRDAEDRLAVALADQVVSRLIAGAPGWT